MLFWRKMGYLPYYFGWPSSEGNILVNWGVLCLKPQCKSFTAREKCSVPCVGYEQFVLWARLWDRDRWMERLKMFQPVSSLYQVAASFAKRCYPQKYKSHIYMGSPVQSGLLCQLKIHHFYQWTPFTFSSFGVNVSECDMFHQNQCSP